MKEIDLKYPVTFNGQEYRRLSMRRPMVRDILAADKAAAGDAEREIRLFASLCEVPTEVIEQMDMADYVSLQEVYSGFLS